MNDAAPSTDTEGLRRGAGGLPRSERRCPRCSARTRLVPNPYYGVGLAVNREISLCTRCEWACSATMEPVAAAPVARLLSPCTTEPAGVLHRAASALRRMLAAPGRLVHVS